MSYSLKQAAEATGRTKPTILRAIQLGKVSAQKDEHGEWQIDPAELHRVYKPVTQDEPIAASVGDGALQREIELLREMLTDRDRQLERMSADKDRQIEGLTRRLETVDEERRTTLRQLTALLTDQRAKPASDVIVTPPPTSNGISTTTAATVKAPTVRIRKPPAAKEQGWWKKIIGGR